jgi:AcrR family transcriptional regulator
MMNAVESASARAVAEGLEELRAARADQVMRADARRNYDRLLAAAAAAFAERGRDDVSLEEIARRAGVGIGTLYRHFPTRAALLEAVYRDQVEALGVLAGKLLAAESPADALAEWVRALAEFSITKHGLSRELVADSPFMPACKTVISESSKAVLERAQQAGVARTDVTSTDLYRMAHGLVMAASSGPGDPGMLNRMLSVLLAGLLNPPPDISGE